ncbi:RDD family protein [uncultured Gimesia sp.]|uniref:RDD family protein n=1 Tax=uncultured Gimesia sp. TaxID=1678688 RepID=UPI00261410FA|nr:RDD family protein [uncultured Gimesia sp.]
MQESDPQADHQLDPKDPIRPLPVDSPQGTLRPRYFASICDNFMAMIGSAIIAKQFPDSQIALQGAVVVACYFAYYLFFEGIFCTTPAKYVAGLTIRNFDGGRCSFLQTLVRTLFRIVEANPLLIGALPAAARIFLSRDKQRFGDKLARTVVVRR